MSNLPEENRDRISQPSPEEIPSETQPAEVQPAEETASPAKKKVEYDESLFEGSTVFSAPEKEKKRKTVRFTPTKRGILFSVLAVVVAAAVAVPVLLLPKNNDDNTPSGTETPTYEVTALKEDKVAQMRLYNANGEILIYPETAEEDASDTTADGADGETEDADIHWLVKGFEEYDLSGAASLVQGTIAITSSKQLDAAEGALLADDYLSRLAELPYGTEAEEDEEANVYGFDHPYAAMTVTGTEETDSFTVLLGCYSPDGAGRYVSVTGDSHVYVVNDSSFSTGTYTFNTTVPDLISTAMVEPIREEEGTADYFVDGSLNYIDTLVLTGSCRTKMVVETAPEELSAVAFVVTDPSFRAGNSDNIGNILSVAESGMYASGAYVLGYTKEDLKKYKLDDPFSVIDINIGTYQVTLTFGEESDGYYPCLVSGSSVIYKVSAAGNEWIAYGSKEIYFDSLFLEYIANISQITVETEEKSVTFHLLRENDDDGTDFDVAVKDYDELNISSDELCYYYGRILALAAEEYASTEIPTDKPYISFTIRYINSGREDVIALYRYSTRRYLYTLNGEGDALVAASIVQDLYDCLDTLLAGETIGRAKY